VYARYEASLNHFCVALSALAEISAPIFPRAQAGGLCFHEQSVSTAASQYEAEATVTKAIESTNGKPGRCWLAVGKSLTIRNSSAKFETAPQFTTPSILQILKSKSARYRENRYLRLTRPLD
jgi:hypothetical protein